MLHDMYQTMIKRSFKSMWSGAKLEKPQRPLSKQEIKKICKEMIEQGFWQVKKRKKKYKKVKAGKGKMYEYSKKKSKTLPAVIKSPTILRYLEDRREGTTEIERKFQKLFDM